MLKYLEVKSGNGAETDQSEGSDVVGSYSLEELKKKMEAAQKKHFGYKNLKDFQIEAVHAVFHKRDSLIVMATGMGKSLCYQIPSLMEEAKKKFTVVISPLISLMTDQVDNLKRKGISSVFLGSGQKISKNQVLTEIKHGMYKIVYCSPEFALNNKQMFVMLRKRILLLAIDEVHCMSEWGHDFRPTYRKLHELKQILVGIPFMGLTATCTREVQNDILKNLNFDMKTCLIKTSSVNKRNLFYCVREKTNILNDLKDVLDIPNRKSLERTKRFIDNSKICPYNSTLIYVTSKKECENIFSFLKEKGLLVRMYHADLSNDEKKEAHEKFLKDEVQIIVATVAFGMGIDKPDIRRIIHYGFSRSLEAYVQQVGRAGRDNSNAEAILFFHVNDESKIKNILLRENIANNLIETNFQRVEHIISMFTDASDYAYSTICRRKKIYEYFDETPNTCTDIDVFDNEDNCGVCFYVKKYDMYLCANCDNCAYYLSEIRKVNSKLCGAKVDTTKMDVTRMSGTKVIGVNVEDISINTDKRQPPTDATSLLKKESRKAVNTTLRISDNPQALSIEEGIDLSAELKTLLSCISSLKGRTGIGVICKVLVKSKESCIIKKGYHNIKEYGDGKHKSTNWWSAFLKVARNDKYIKETLVYGKDLSYLSVGLTPKGEAFIMNTEQRYTVRLPFFLVDKEKKAKSGKGTKKTNARKSENEPVDYLYNEKASQRNRWNNIGEDFNYKEKRDHVSKEEKPLEGEKRSSVLSATHGSISHQTEGVYSITQASVDRNNTIPDNKYGYFNTDKNQCRREHQYKEEKLTEEKINDSIMRILLRTRIIEARQQNIPPFQLISDKPLKDICHKRLTSVHLIRKHVDNISPVCPNSFLEKLISGIRGFCLLHDLDMNINLNTASQNMGSPEGVERQISSLNKFSNLISSYQYDHKTEKLGGDSSFQGASSREIRSGPYVDGGVGSSVVHNGMNHGSISHGAVVRNYACREEETPSYQSMYFNGGAKTEMKMDVSGSWIAPPGGQRNHPTGKFIGGAKPMLNCDTNHPNRDFIEKRSAKETILGPFCTNAEATNELHHISSKDKSRLMDFFEDDFKFIKETNKSEFNPNGSLVDNKREQRVPIDFPKYTFQGEVWRGSNAAQPIQIGNEVVKPNERNFHNRTNTITRLSTLEKQENGGAWTGPRVREAHSGDPFRESFPIRRTMGENHVDVLNDKKKKLDFIDSFSYDYKKQQDEDNLGRFPGRHDGTSSFQDFKRRRF
ncbi:ATP-dependent DNA helicase, putative [Plasmodium knowlesi strain H]|uniref:DNA 3'-5' helicase n=3 Tax=Plasmodium knowlesi TaxID=5850 RepID=A0A5K1UGS6_PLAKH|nr:ADP-dependent DNA helicase RecQ, putative [Plasmodium knowlesi strain H]OTN67715.1 putative ATP-dependent DNA helicase [Plasmodium knowlesi]CAA9990324.1 ADP-dependent DNA helicase RecQ, putative [Plasmodium knowlesi strain H]SBO19530.1 ATP-dependent DNA helicase, putative [Plasmodium knowlesi strain H]SBO22777.1 ATP-dependent DNA helicase, putative [Plasmodium knowlesi strain H]VVS79798.1 ADP-dependent DNA helicase RecQ, putative [Plasmodium knowlesi strain H]|eukprot:XP_002260724.1 ATP-dependent DNA helicase, putative [Plasmodium knowlesi strain H]